MRTFLDRLPLVIQAKPDPGAQSASARPKEIAQLLDATLQHRRVVMRYHSFSSEREKAYTVEPSRLVFAQGALYLMAYVPEYSQVRTFAVDRIKSLSLTEERFEPVESDEAVFAHSLGVHHRSRSCSNRGSLRTCASGCGTAHRPCATRPTDESWSR
jgi:hypothetical protein